MIQLILRIFFLALPATLVFAQTFTPLPMEDADWLRQVFQEDGGITNDQACPQSFFTDPTYGDGFTIGPWLAGRWYCRQETAAQISITDGTIRGWYKTTGTPPHSVFLSVEYHTDDVSDDERKTYRLPNVDYWTQFEIVTRYPLSTSNQIKLWVGLDSKTTGTVSFAGIETSPNVPAEFFPADPGTVTRAVRGVSTAGTFHRIRNDNGTWWFVDPSGNDWYSLATTVYHWGSSETETSGRAAAAAMRDMRLNSVAAWSNINRWSELNTSLSGTNDQQFPLFVAIGSAQYGTSFDFLEKSNGDYTAPGDTSHAFPDPWDPAFVSAYTSAVSSIASVLTDKPWFVGWFVANELSAPDLYRHVYSTAAAVQFKAHLQGLYATIGALNTAWGTSYADFDALIAAKPDPELHSGTMYDDFKSFEELIIREFATVTHDIIAAADPGRLIFGPRLHRVIGLEVWLEHLDELSAFDALAVNLYPGDYTWDSGLDESLRQILAEMYAQSGKPIIVGEWSVPAIDSGLYADESALDRSWDEAVGTQDARGRQAALYQVDLANIPYVIGSHWFTWYDYNSPARYANRGLFEEDNVTPWTALQDHLTEANRRIMESGTGFSGCYDPG